MRKDGPPIYPLDTWIDPNDLEMWIRDGNGKVIGVRDKSGNGHDLMFTPGMTLGHHGDTYYVQFPDDED